MTTHLVEREMVRTDEGLAALCDDLRRAGRFALDTEFLGERTYVPRLCLVQIATTEFIALVDTVAVKKLAPLWALVADPAIETVLHAAREDLRLAYYGSGRAVPQGIFDTQVAAGFVGLPLYPLSYARLVEALEGVKLAKGETRSEWDRRPLSPEQIRYARDDVRYLLPMADKLAGALRKLGRADWMADEMGRYGDIRTFETDPELAYLRLRGSRGGFSARPTALLRAVTAWREREAANRDIPVRMLLRDEALSEIALRSPRRLTDLSRLRNFPPGEETDLGPGILSALDAARALPEDQLPPPLAGAADDGTPAERAAGDLLYALGESLCLSRHLSPDLVLSRSDALALARGLLDPMLTTGWRREALGEELALVATGKQTAQVRMTPEGPQVTLSATANSG